MTAIIAAKNEYTRRAGTWKTAVHVKPHQDQEDKSEGDTDDPEKMVAGEYQVQEVAVVVKVQCSGMAEPESFTQVGGYLQTKIVIGVMRE